MARFEPMDMSGRVEPAQMCESLQDMIQELKKHGKAGLSDVIRYSYILSIQTFTESMEAMDYGRCEEYEA